MPHLLPHYVIYVFLFSFYQTIGTFESGVSTKGPTAPVPRGHSGEMFRVDVASEKAAVGLQ